MGEAQGTPVRAMNTVLSAPLGSKEMDEKVLAFMQHFVGCWFSLEHGLLSIYKATDPQKLMVFREINRGRGQRIGYIVMSGRGIPPVVYQWKLWKIFLPMWMTESARSGD